MTEIIPLCELTEENLEVMREKAKTKHAFQKVQTLALKKMGFTNLMTSKALSIGHATVSSTLKDYRCRGEDALFIDGRGGRKNQYLNLEEEVKFLKPFLKEASAGGILTVSVVRRAYEKRVGCKVQLSTIYAMLHRNGWRKISPRPKHPKGDEKVQKRFKTLFPPHHKKSGSQG
jgi:transposase